MKSGPFPLPRLPAHLPSVPATFTVAVTRPGAGVTVIDPGGELDTLSSPQLDRCLDQELRAHRARPVVLDMSHLRFCGAAGLSSLCSADDLAREQRIGLDVVPGAMVWRLLGLVGLQDRFTVHHDLPAALAAASTMQPARPHRSRPGSAPTGRAATAVA